MSNTIVQNPFVPTSIPGCVCWLDATDINTLFQNTAGTTPVTRLGQQVQFIRDKSASGNNFSTIDTVVTYNTGMVGTTLPSLYNAVTMANGWTGSVTIPLNSTYFHVKCLTQGNAIYLYHQGTSRLKQTWNYTNGSSFVSQWDYNGQPGIFGVTNRVNVTDVITRQDIASPCTLTGWETGNIRGPGGYSQAQVPVQTYSAITLWGGGATGWYGELIIFNTALASSDRERVEGYLAWKWGAQAQLPSSTPYKNTPAAIITAPNILPILNNTNRLNNAAFLPTQVPGCQLWFDAADRASMTFSGSTVTQWNDKSGNGRNATNGVYAAPTYSATGFNGRYPGLLFNGSTTMLNTAALLPTPVLSANGTDTTIFVVFNYNFVGGVNNVVYGLGSQNNTYVLRSPWNPGSFGTVIIDTTSVAPNSSRISITFGGFQPAPQLYSILRSGASHLFYQFGSLTASNLSSTGTVGTTSQTFGIGGGISDTGFFGSFISEMIIYNVALTTIERQQVEGYLAWKWGLQGSLGPTHPYKNTSAVFVTQPNILAVLGTRSYNNTLLSGYFNPRNIAGCSLWLDGADKSPASMTLSGTTVTTWRDKSANANNAAGVNSPQVLSTGGVAFSSGSHFTISSPYPRINTVFMVASGVNSVSGAGAYYWNFDVTNGGGTIINNNVNAGGGPLGWYFDGPSVAYFVNGLNLVSPFLVSVVRNPSVSALGYYNGSQVFTISAFTPGTATVIRLIGAATLVGANTLNGNIYEFIVYNGALTANQRQQVEGYLAWKWNLQSSLPPTHLFKNYPPSP
jgi:hypothetical protein